jgi:hypothetical protein
MLTNADVCWCMLTYTDVCGRMVTQADVCVCQVEVFRRKQKRRHNPWFVYTLYSREYIHTYIHTFNVCWRVLTCADMWWRVVTYAVVCWRMTYADVCWRMPTYADVCWRMLTYAYEAGAWISSTLSSWQVHYLCMSLSIIHLLYLYIIPMYIYDTYVCMYVCMYIYVYSYIYTYVYMYICIIYTHTSYNIHIVCSGQE